MNDAGGNRWSSPPRRPLLLVAATLGIAVAAAWLLQLDLQMLWSAGWWGDAWQRLHRFGGGLLAPTLDAATLLQVGGLAVDTLAIALLGTALGLLLAVPLALGSSRTVMGGDGVRRWTTSLVVEAFRLLLDVLRGVPDFVWAVLLANVFGVGPVTGLLAIAVSVAGVLGKVLGEQWDNLSPAKLLPVRTTGASRLLVFAYGIAPLGARTSLAFVLMRFECTVRNASVIGVVGGGGLGAGLWDAFTDGDWSRVATLLAALLAVTAAVDLGTNLLRRRLRTDPNHPRLERVLDRGAARRRRLQVAAVLALAIGAAAWHLAAPFAQACGELSRIEWQFVWPYTLGMFTPSLEPATWLAVLRAALVPLAIGLLATLLGAAMAAVLAPFASTSLQLEAHRFCGERLTVAGRLLRAATVVLARAIALLQRGVPEVAWLIVLAVLLKNGVTPCVLAIALHSAGVLHRVFTDAVDDLPFARLERVGVGRGPTFVYGALPAVAATWRSYALFQFEVNVRAGVALGLVGAGGLGQLFRHNLAFREHADAAAFLWGMVLLTVAIDRAARALQLRRLRC